MGMSPDKRARLLANLDNEFATENYFDDNFTGEVKLVFNKGGVQKGHYIWDSDKNEIDPKVVLNGKVTHIHNGVQNKVTYEKVNQIKNVAKQ